MNTRIMSKKQIAGPLLILLFTLAGCADQAPTSPGTQGELLSAGGPLPEMKLTVYRVEGQQFTAIGSAVTGWDGRFGLYNLDASEPLWLVAGEYRFTLESAGAPIKVPTKYLKPDSSTLVYHSPGQEQPVTIGVKENLLPKAK